MNRPTNGEYVAEETIPAEIVTLQARGYKVVDEHLFYDALPEIEHSLETAEATAPVVPKRNK